MASPARFTFDLDLRAGAVKPPPPPTISPAEHQDAIAAARAEGYARGFADGEGGVTAQGSRQLNGAANALVDAIDGLLLESQNERARYRSEAIDLAASIGRKLAAHLMAREPAAELEALIAECLSSLENVPHLVIRCHPDLADRIQKIASERMRSAHFAGRLVVMGEPELALGDGRIEWVDGGLVRDSGAIAAAIDERIQTYLAARDGTETGAEA